MVYDSSQVSTEDLVKNFWEIHDPTQVNRQGNDVGNNYRSAIYWTNEDQKNIAVETGKVFQKLLNAKGYGEIVTEMAASRKFLACRKLPPRLSICETQMVTVLITLLV